VTQPTTLGGYQLNAGDYVTPCVYIAHRRADVFEEPLRFPPERFLERSYSP
jgi:cytochrome P450 family 110